MSKNSWKKNTFEVKYQLRNASSRLIKNAYGRHKEGMLNIISAGTGVGKTYSIQNILVPIDIKEGKNKFLFLTVYKDNVEQDYKDFKESLRGIADVTKDVNEFLEADDNYPIVLVSSCAGAVNGGINNTNGVKLLEFLKKHKGSFSVYWDEAHFGGSSSEETYGFNTGHTGHNYKASYYSFVESLAPFGKVTGFTATPLFEQKGLLPKLLQTKMYNFLTTKEDWATLEELTEITSQYSDIEFYNSDKDGFELGIQKSVNKYISYSENQKLSSELINSHHPDLKLNYKTIMMLNSGADNGSFKSLAIHEQIDIVKEYTKNKFPINDYIFGKATEEGYLIGNLKGEWKQIETLKQFVSKMENTNDPLRFIFFIEKFKFGLNVPNITHEVHSREREQKHNIVTVSILQIFGRAVRTYFGIDKSMFKNKKVPNFVSDAIKWLLDEYSDSPVFDELRKYMLNANSHSFVVPETKTFIQGVKDWTNENNPYAAPLSMSQFHMIDSNGEKKTAVPSGKERELDYKKHKEEYPYCQQHKGNSCKEQCRNLDQYKSLTNDEFNIAWIKALQVNHIDGDRNNNSPENLETVCPNYHMVETQVKGHTKNKY